MESRNLMIRPTVVDDCRYFEKWEQDPEVVQYFNISEGQTYEEVVTRFVRNEDDPSKLQYTIVLKTENRPIGRIIISKLNREEDSLDIYRIYIAEPEKRNCGYGKEALYALLEYCFINMHMERVSCYHFTGNEAAAHLFRRMGFQNEGIARSGSKKDGRYYDLQFMSILRSEFFENRNI